MTVGVLSTINSPLLIPTVAALLAEGLTDVVLLLDEMIASEKDLAIWQQRTDGYFELRNTNIYGFADPPPVHFIRNHNSDACVGVIRKLGLSLLLNAGTPRKLKPQVLGATPHGVLNVHPGILPNYRGASCVEWAIYNDDQVGNTAHFMDEEYDAGPIIALEPYTFPRDVDYKTIRCLTYERGFALMARTTAQVLANDLRPANMKPQVPGHLWEPIPPEKMAKVLQKIETKQYRYLTD